MRDFEALPHTADLKIRVYGASLSELFSNALIGMFQSIEPVVPQCKIIDERVVCQLLPAHHTIKIASSEVDLLLIDFLSEALYLSDVHNEAYLAVDVHIFNERALEATIKGVPVKRFGIEIKAVTYHDLKILKTNDGYQVDIVFDI
ncbi:MAG: archease [Candidatus Babeliales bacterium]